MCMSNYPQAALREERQGTTQLLFSITADGQVAGVIIAASSRSLDLDFAAAVCATKWLYQPATENNRPVEVSWEASTTWWLPGGDRRSSAPKIRVPAKNCIRANPDSLSRAKAGRVGLTIVRYQLLDGEVKGAVIEKSSGDAVLDGYATECVLTWHFEPVMGNGNAATGAQAAIFDWLQEPPLPKKP